MDKKLPLALKVNDLDNVATVFSNEAKAGSDVEVRDKKGNSETVTVIGDVPYGHKIAVRDIKKGELIIKYGEETGAATKVMAGLTANGRITAESPRMQAMLKMAEP